MIPCYLERQPLTSTPEEGCDEPSGPDQVRDLHRGGSRRPRRRCHSVPGVGAWQGTPEVGTDAIFTGNVLGGNGTSLRAHYGIAVSGFFNATVLSNDVSGVDFVDVMD